MCPVRTTAAISVVSPFCWEQNRQHFNPNHLAGHFLEFVFFTRLGVRSVLSARFGLTFSSLFSIVLFSFAEDVRVRLRDRPAYTHFLLQSSFAFASLPWGTHL